MALAFYEVKRDGASVILPKETLSVAVATEGNIHFSFKTGLKQDLSLDPNNPKEKEVIEQYDIQVTKDAQKLLYDLMTLDYRIVDILGEIQKVDPKAQARYPDLPTLVFKGKETSIAIPALTLGNINLENGAVVISTREGKHYKLGTEQTFDFPTFMETLQERTMKRLTKEVDLAELGIVSILG